MGIVVGVAYVNHIQGVINNEGMADSVTLLIQFGTLTGLGEEILEVLVEFALYVGSLENTLAKCLFVFENCVALVELIIMIYVVSLVGDDSVFVGVSVTVLVLASCGICNIYIEFVRNCA